LRDEAVPNAAPAQETDILNDVETWLDPPLEPSGPGAFSGPLSDTWIDRRVVQSDDYVRSNLDTVFSGSVVVGWSDRLQALGSAALGEAAYLGFGLVYLAEHMGGEVLGAIGEGINATDKVIPGFATSLESFQGLGPEFALLGPLSRGTLFQARMNALQLRGLTTIDRVRLGSGGSAANNAVARFNITHYYKPLKGLPDIVDLRAELRLHQDAINQIIREEGIEGLKSRIRQAQDPVVWQQTEQLGRRATKSLGTAGEALVWPHYPDMKIGLDPFAIGPATNARINVILGGNVQRLAEELLKLEAGIREIHLDLELTRFRK
jgi:hypothetical protein